MSLSRASRFLETDLRRGPMQPVKLNIRLEPIVRLALFDIAKARGVAEEDALAQIIRDAAMQELSRRYPALENTEPKTATEVTMAESK